MSWEDPRRITHPPNDRGEHTSAYPLALFTPGVLSAAPSVPTYVLRNRGQFMSFRTYLASGLFAAALLVAGCQAPEDQTDDQVITTGDGLSSNNRYIIKFRDEVTSFASNRATAALSAAGVPV